MSRDVTFLAAGLVGSGVLHFVRPQPYEHIVPKPLPYKRELVLVSGAVEIVCGAMMLHPRTRRLGGLGAVGLLAAVFPANVQMSIDALRSRKAPGWFKAGTLARLPLQVPMIKVAAKAANS